MTTVTIRNRSRVDFIMPDVQLDALLYRTEAQGGHQYALIRASGEADALFRLLEWLRYDVQIHDENGSAVWWGYVNRAAFDYDGISQGFSLDTMANTVAVLYADDTGGGQTTWAADSESIAQFGIKERLLSASGVNEPAAEQIRDTALGTLKYPVKEHTLGREGNTISALLECRGDFDALEWTHYDRDEGLVEHAAASGASQKVGWGFTSSEVAFTGRTYAVSELNNKLNELEKGEKIAVTGSSSNNGALTVVSAQGRVRETITDTSIAFLIEAKVVRNEHRRASHNVARKLNNDNLFALQVKSISTLSVTANATDTTLTLATVDNLQSGDRIRIAIDAGGYHETFVSGAPDTGANTLRIQDEMPSTATSGNDVDRFNRWVTNENDDVYYVETTDYTVDTTNGKFTALSTGSIANNQVLHISYKYVEYRIEDGNLGLGLAGSGDVVEVSGSGSNDGYYRVLSTGSEGDRLTVKEAVADEGPGATVTIARGSNATVEEVLTAELPGASVTVTAWGHRVVQSFTIPSDEAWTVNLMMVRARKVGSPADSLRLGIRADSSGPGSLLESVDIPADDLSTQLAWATGQMLNTLSLAVGTTYWVSVGRSGALDPDNYYEVAVDEDLGYTGGALKLYDGAAYQDRPVDADLVFRLLGAEETTTQIQKLITQEGQFLNGHDVIDASGLETNQYRAGRTTALLELEDLLDIGTTSGRRLLASVTNERMLRVAEEPAEPSMPDYIYYNKTKITDGNGRMIPPGSMEFVGKWMGLSFTFGGVDAAWWARQGVFLVESAEYIVEQGEWEIVPRGSTNPWEIGRLQNA